MTTSVSDLRPLARSVEVTNDELLVGLADGRRIAVPLAWFPRLLGAPPAVREHWELLGAGDGIHWPEADEDLSVSGLLAGTRAPAQRRRGAV